MHNESKRTPDDDRLKIAVFVDFDNIEIGVKTTLNRHFDIGSVLETIKERGEVVTKVAYGNWKQAESYSREMTEHAVHMIQRNTTPGGDKNGADINLALDALEMAFTRDHINAFVIVGGDSDFIALVEKLKQYDKKVFIVGGRAFTSIILQKNCHEFIAYENLIGLQPGSRRIAGRGAASSSSRLERAMPLLRRALKVLSDREVSPQLGLLKSTLLQLDSTFSERDYGAGTFREFIQKLAHAGLVKLKQVDRSLLVELKEGDAGAPAVDAATPKADTPAAARGPHVPTAETAEGLRRMRAAFQSAGSEARWPMYLRNIKQFLTSEDPYFDERHFSLSRIHDLVREGQRAGLFRIERSRQGGLRVLPGAMLAGPSPADAAVDSPPDAQTSEGLPVVPPDTQPSESMPDFPAEPAAAPSPELAPEVAPEPHPEVRPSGNVRARATRRSGKRKTPAKTGRKAADPS